MDQYSSIMSLVAEQEMKCILGTAESRGSFFLFLWVCRGGGVQTDRFYFLNYRKFNSSTDSKLDYYLATKKIPKFYVLS
jgi:hypothetical protein